MKGTLLGGFKIWLQDGEGLPLSAPGGRVKFYKANTAEPLEVYSSSAMTVSLGTVVKTDINGYLPDVWLRGDYLYDVVVERRIGEDPEVWAKLYEVEDVGEILEEDFSTQITSTIIVSNMAELRAVNHAKYGVVYVLGYNTPGDVGSPMMFKYGASVRKVDDGGSIILPNDVLVTEDGRWLQVFNEAVIDVRKFGAIPGSGRNLTTNITNCIIYCKDLLRLERPISVGFLQAGTYEMLGDFDMDQYTYTIGGKTLYVHFVINDGVVFENRGQQNTLTVGRNSDIFSTSPIVGSYYALSVPGKFKGVVDAIWFGNAGNAKDAIVLGYGDMPVTTEDSITIYRDLHKVDLWGVPLKKIDNGIAMVNGSNIVFSYELSGSSVKFRAYGDVEISGKTKSGEVYVYGTNTEYYTKVGNGSLDIVGGGTVNVLHGTVTASENLRGKKVQVTDVESTSVDTTNLDADNSSLKKMNLNAGAFNMKFDLAHNYKAKEALSNDVYLWGEFPNATLGEIVFLQINSISGSSSRYVHNDMQYFERSFEIKAGNIYVFLAQPYTSGGNEYVKFIPFSSIGEEGPWN